jgi:hypothetical protein
VVPLLLFVNVLSTTQGELIPLTEACNNGKSLYCVENSQEEEEEML